MRNWSVEFGIPTVVAVGGSDRPNHRPNLQALLPLCRGVFTSFWNFFTQRSILDHLLYFLLVRTPYLGQNCTFPTKFSGSFRTMNQTCFCQTTVTLSCDIEGDGQEKKVNVKMAFANVPCRNCRFPALPYVIWRE